MKKLFILSAILALTGLGSCKKWLDARPDQTLYVDEVLKDRQGFARALAGVYSQMAGASLYGRELEFGMLDVMASYWVMTSTHVYYPDYLFSYRDAGVEQRVSAIWSGMYDAIHACNVILQQIDQLKTDPYYGLIKGETLGLRAFLHFELLKLFGPVIKQRGLDTRSIPYYKAPTKKAQEFLTSRACLELIEQDLQAAKDLLADDPILTQGRKADGNKAGDVYDSLLDRRGIHLNYYAVLALLARKSQWEGNLQEAGTRARFLLDKLTNSKAVSFMDASEVLKNIEDNVLGDIRFAKENIFGLYINDLINIKNIYSSNQINRGLKPNYNAFLKDLYTRGTGNAQDLRILAWWVSRPMIIKLLYPFPHSGAYNPDHYEAQLINLSEVYFILVESYLQQDLKKALGYLNVVRQARRLPALEYSVDLTKEKIADYLLDEVRREYIGEGYLFTYYKHLNHGIYRAEGIIPAEERIFVFPVPPEEGQLNPNN